MREVKITTTPKQQLAIKAWNDSDINDLVYGGYAGGGKTMCGGTIETSRALSYPGTKQFIARKELKTLMTTTYITLTQKVFPQYGLKPNVDWHLNGQTHVIHFSNGSTIDLLDLAFQPSDPLYDRFGSSEYTNGWVEEASEAPFKAVDVLRTRVGRWKNKEYNLVGKTLYTLNPSQDWPYRIFYDPWKKAGRPVDLNNPLVSMRTIIDGEEITRKFIFIPAEHKDNQYIDKNYIFNLATISDPVLRARLKDGDWEFANANDTLFTADVIADFFTNIIEESKEVYLIVDAARFGGDEIILNHFKGWDSFKIDRYVNQPLTTTSDQIRTAANMYGIPRNHILIDEDGIGGGLLDLLPGAIGFHGGAAPFGKVGEQEVRENYENLKSQCAYHLSKLGRERKIRISEINVETRELASRDFQQIKRRDADKDGKLKIVKKEDVKMALGRSPDVGDTFIMRSYFDLREREQEFAEDTEMTVFIPEY